MKLETLDLRRNLPLGGILAFSLCSTWSLYQLLTRSAAHPTPLFWLPAVLVELVTSWAVYNVVEQARRVTMSNISKQDRRFYGLMLGAFVAVAIPTLGASVWANTIEFGNVLLGALFPVGSIGCAVGVALPDTVSRYEKRKEADARDHKATRVDRKKSQKLALQKMKPARRQQEIIVLVQETARTTQDLAQLFARDPSVLHRDCQRLQEQGKIKKNGEGWTIV